ncbi:hypothetical protein [Rhodopseudomonas pseudopalustris]|uniref:Uncharacterized protein n=1 Tax=Rhodopseudomonas pseudopalustris TaxID=1513892 RepID=A0A1H8SQ92_9BRAD|nr:hypothetical protein [Rhodopseudomonas pseudopalustris]SEO80811.1 hypothetical protein SAMN05444123_10521 [Rhodopseudomonas pseudopalustris]
MTSTLREEMRTNAVDVTRRRVQRSYQPLCKDIEEATHEAPDEQEAPPEEVDEASEEEDVFDPWIVASFGELIRSAFTDAPFALVPCRVNGEPSACIALTKGRGRKLWVQPLFVAVTASIAVTGRDDPPEPSDTG